MLDLFTIAGAVAAPAAIAVFLLVKLTKVQERARADKRQYETQIKVLREMLANRDRLSDPDTVDRVLDAFTVPQKPATGDLHNDPADTPAAAGSSVPVGSNEKTGGGG